MCLQDTLETWNKGELESFLVEATEKGNPAGRLACPDLTL